MRERGWLSGPDYETARAGAARARAARPAAPLAPHFVERRARAAGTRRGRPRGSTRTLDATLQRHVQGIIAAHRSVLDRHHAGNVAVAVLDNRIGGMARVGRIGQLLRCRARRRDRRRRHATAAGFGAEALHLRGGVRARLSPGDACWRTCRRSSRRRSRRAVQPAQLRRPLPRSAAGAGGARRIRERAGGRPRVGDRRPGRAAAAPARRVLDARQQRGALRPRPHARQRRSAARRDWSRPTPCSRAAASFSSRAPSARSTAASPRRRTPSV